MVLFFRTKHELVLKPCNLKNHESYDWIDTLQGLGLSKRIYVILYPKNNKLNNI